MHALEGLHILILGLGVSGLAMARWCARRGAVVTVADTREQPPQLATLQREWPQVRFVSGPFDATLLEGTTIRAVLHSPGLAPHVVAPVTEAARAAGLWQGGELSLFCAALRELREQHAYAPQVLAITGTNGKTTVTSLTGLLLSRAGKRVRVAGNIGPTLLDTLEQALEQAHAEHQAQHQGQVASDEVTSDHVAPIEEPQASTQAVSTVASCLPEVWVLELSSFQLQSSEDFEPTAATVLNLSQDHLDWHGTVDAYAAAKSRIFGHHALMVLNREDPAVMGMLPEPVRVKLQKPQWRTHTTFGSDMPQRPGDWGIESVQGMQWLVRAMDADETHKRRTDEAQALHIQRLMPADALRIRGRHNATNALAALALASSTGCALAPMLYGLREYRGERHRVEPVGIVNDVEYFDDSKGTNVGATVAALQGLGPDRRLVVILGGDGKGQDFAPLCAPLSQYARAVVLIGKDAALIDAAVQDCGVPRHSAHTLPEAVHTCAQLAQPGDAVLLSPACASLDMFEHYGQRGEVFRAAVQVLAETHGVVLEGAA